MLYAILSQDVEDSSSLRKVASSSHIAYLNALRDSGKLLITGVNPALDTHEPGSAGYIGSLTIAEFTSLEAAKTWASEDPFLAAGVYAHVDVKPFNKVLP